MSTLVMGFSFAGSISGWWTSSEIYTRTDNPIITEHLTEEAWNPLRKGVGDVIAQEGWSEGIGGVRRPEEFDGFDAAKNTTVGVIKNAINYALSFAWLIALIYLISHGFMVLTAMDDESKHEKWLQWIKTAAIALGGIGVSWLVVSFIFYLVDLFTKV